jgi:regulator of protease activity HflC (stomatin/prohibitin superfamily)
MKNSIILTAFLFLTACGFEVVDTGFRGIETNMGQVVGEPKTEGLYFYNPLTSNIVEYQVREDKYQDETTAFTKDTQQVKILFTIIWKPNDKQVHTLYKEVGQTSAVEEKILKPIVLGSLKDAIGQLIADDLVSKRDIAAKAALESVREALNNRHIIITDLQLTNLDFDDQYEKAVEEKVVAQQLAQKAVNETVRIKEEAKQTVETAKADAEAMKIKSAALSQNKNLVEYEAVLKWDGKLPEMMMGGGSVPFINLNTNKGSK